MALGISLPRLLWEVEPPSWEEPSSPLEELLSSPVLPVPSPVGWVASSPVEVSSPPLEPAPVSPLSEVELLERTSSVK